MKALLSKILNSLSSALYYSEATVYGNYCKVRRTGNVVNLWGVSDGGWNIPSGSYVNLTTLPEQFRPDHNVNTVADAYGGSQHITIGINSNGIVNFYSTGSTAWWRYNVTYIVGGGSQ